MKKRASFILAMLLSIACAKKSPPATTMDGGLAVSIAEPVKPKPDLPTTSWSIAEGNFDGLIAEHERLNRADPKSRATLVDLLLTRAQALGRIADYERAEIVAMQVANEHPKNADALLTRARVHGALHRFSAALDDIEAAEKAGTEKTRIDAARASILVATGKYLEAASLLPSEARGSVELTTAAVLAARMQKPRDAERLFDQAREAVRDVSPFLVAWMDFQRATVLEAEGKTTLARIYYLEAVEKIPVSAHAVVHLASSDPPEAAIARLTPLLKTSDDPDVLAALADAHRRAKQEDEARRFREMARARYEAVLAKYPEAFADHAAHFHLALGNTKEALDLAARNARLRATEDAIDLWLAAATAAHDQAAICASAAALGALRFVSEERKRLALASQSRCSRDGD